MATAAASTTTTRLAASAIEVQRGRWGARAVVLGAGVDDRQAVDRAVAPAHGAGQGAGDQRVERDALVLGDAGQLGVQRLRHADEQAPGVRALLLGLGLLDLSGGHLLARVRLVPLLDNGRTHPVDGAADEARDLRLGQADLAGDLDLAAVLVVAHLQDALLALGEHAHAGLQQRALVGEVVGGGGGVLGLELDRRRP